MNEFTSRVAAQDSVHNFTLLCRAACPGLAGDVVVAVTLAALRAVCRSEPSVSRLHTNACSLAMRLRWIIPSRVSSDRTYWPVLSTFISASTLTQWDTFIPTEDKARVTDTPLHAGMVTRATRAGGVLTAGLGTGGATGDVMTAWGTLQS